MSLRALKTAAGMLLACVALTAGVLLRQAPAAAAKHRAEDIPADLATLHALIRPHPDEVRCRWMTDIPWQTSLWEARQQAAAQGKPILVVGSGGGSPLGRC